MVINSWWSFTKQKDIPNIGSIHGQNAFSSTLDPLVEIQASHFVFET